MEGNGVGDTAPSDSESSVPTVPLPAGPGSPHQQPPTGLQPAAPVTAVSSDNNGGAPGKQGIVILQQPRPGFVRSFKQTSLPPIRMKPTGIMPKKNVLKERPVIVKKRLPSPGAPILAVPSQPQKIMPTVPVDDEAAAIAEAKATASAAAAAAAAAAAIRAKTSTTCTLPYSPTPPKSAIKSPVPSPIPAAPGVALQRPVIPSKKPLDTPSAIVQPPAPRIQATMVTPPQVQTPPTPVPVQAPANSQQPPLKKLAVLAATPVQSVPIKTEGSQAVNISQPAQIPILRPDSQSEQQQLRPLKVLVTNPQSLGTGDVKAQLQTAIPTDATSQVQLGKVLPSLPKARLVPASISPKVVVGAPASHGNKGSAPQQVNISGIQAVQQPVPTAQPNTTQVAQQITVSSAKLQSGQFQFVAANGQKYVLTSSLFPTFTTTSQGNVAQVQTSASNVQSPALPAVNQPITLQLGAANAPVNSGSAQIQHGKQTLQQVSGAVIKGKPVPVQQALAKIATSAHVSGGQRIQILPTVQGKSNLSLIPGLTLTSGAQTLITPGIKSPQAKITTLGQVGALTNNPQPGIPKPQGVQSSGTINPPTPTTVPTTPVSVIYQPPVQGSKNTIVMAKPATGNQPAKTTTTTLQQLIPHHIIAGGNNQILLQSIQPVLADGAHVTPNSGNITPQHMRTKIVQAPVQIASAPAASAPNKLPDTKPVVLPPPASQSGGGTLVTQPSTLMQPQLLQTCGAQATIGLIQVPMVNLSHPIQLPTTAGPSALAPSTNTELVKSSSTTPQLVASNAISPGQIFQLVQAPGKLPILSPALKDIEAKHASTPIPIAPAIKPAVKPVEKVEQTVVVKEEPKEPLSSIDVAIKYGTYPQAPIPMGKRKAAEMEEDVGKDDMNKVLKVDVESKPEEENPDFSWDEYLEMTGATAAPSPCFPHVEASLQCYVKTGMKVEVPNPVLTFPIHVKSYWVATIVAVSGSLILLRYDGWDEGDRSGDFWWDLVNMEVHPIGWCARNGYVLQPPNALIQKPINWQEFLIQTLTGTKTIPEQILREAPASLYPVMGLKRGLQVDVIDERCPLQAWICTIMENCGGRLKLRYLGYTHEDQDFWLFYQSWRVHPLGWAKDRKVAIGPPKIVKDQNPQCNAGNYQSLYKAALTKAGMDPSLPPELFKEHNKINVHKFLAGMRLEAVNPKAPSQICPATVTDVFNVYFFRVTIDDLRPEAEREEIRVTCHGMSGGIFPVGWAHQNGVAVTPPKGFLQQGNHFDWNAYLRHVKGKPAHRALFKLNTEHDFQHGMKLEAVNPFNANQVCPATVTKIAGRHMWLHFDGSKLPNHIVDVESTDIFPVGWCDSSGHHLRTPKKLLARKTKRVAIVWPEKMRLTPMSPGRDLYHRVREVREAARDEDGAEEDWIDKVYYNHKCFSGPYLNKGRIAELPKSVGPGMVPLVLREVLHMLINAAYKPPRVLRELQVENEETAGMNGSLHVMKAKYKGKSYHAMIELCKTASEVPGFLRSTCLNLECCPNLVSLNQVTDTCPEQCFNLTKSKYIQAYGRKHKMVRIGRPPGCKPSKTAEKKGGPGRKRKKRRQLFIHRKKHNLKTESPEQGRGDPATPRGDGGAGGGGPEAEARRREVMHSAKKPLVSVAKALLDSAKRTKLQHSAPKLVLPHRERGTKMKTFAARLTSSRAQKKEEERQRQEEQERLLMEQHQKRQKQQQQEQERHKHKHTKDKKPRPNESENTLHLDSNPLHWSVDKVVKFIKKTDCAPLAKIFKEQEIDGQALLLLTLPTVQECMELKLGPAIKLCHHIERVKIAFYEQYAS
ncbi:uncharacterized protein [Diadema antillarum]|uniref:uncharacterized protein n=1 Tax=Diadema antillarum TaxID=105358 RepID=UPI003A842EFA